MAPPLSYFRYLFIYLHVDILNREYSRCFVVKGIFCAQMCIRLFSTALITRLCSISFGDLEPRPYCLTCSIQLRKRCLKGSMPYKKEKKKVFKGTKDVSRQKKKRCFTPSFSFFFQIKLLLIMDFSYHLLYVNQVIS